MLLASGVTLVKARAAVKSLAVQQTKQAFLDIGDDGSPVVPLSTECQLVLDSLDEVAPGKHLTKPEV